MGHRIWCLTSIVCDVRVDFERVNDILMLSSHVVVATDIRDFLEPLKGRVWLSWSDGPIQEFYFVVSTRGTDRAELAATVRQVVGTGAKPIFLVNHASEALHDVAVQKSVSYVAIRDGKCVIDGRVWPEPAVRTRLLNSSLCALIRVLLSTSKPYPQDRPAAERGHGGPFPSLVDAVQVVQPHISALLADLPAGTVKRVTGGWIATDFDRLWDVHLEKFEGPGGDRTGWQSSRGRTTQARDLREAVRAASARTGTVIQTSGFEGMASELREAAWAKAAARRSTAFRVLGPATTYSHSFTSTLSKLGYIRCPLSAASVQLVSNPIDGSLQRTAAAWGSGRRTDPLVTAWELRNASLAAPLQAALREKAQARRLKN